MSERRRPAPLSSRTVRPPLIVALALVLVLATIGSFAAGFGVMTDCTNAYSCTTTGCRPCSETSTWLAVGWVVQGVLLLIGTALAVLGARRIHLRAVRLGALLLSPASILLFAASTSLAVRSF
jgi:hypothetical protein